MNSPFSKIFLAIMDRIEKSVPAISHIDQNFGQLEGNSARASVMFPNILVDFQGWVFSDIGGGAQIGRGNVIVSLGHAQYAPGSNHMEPVFREQSLKVFELEWEINKVLHGWSPGDEFGYLTRTNADSKNLAAGIRVRPLTYNLEFEDYSTRPEVTYIPLPPPEINKEFLS